MELANVSKSRYVLFGGYVLLCLLALIFLQKERSPGANQEGSLELFPHTYDRMPWISSPTVMEDGTEIVVAYTKEKKYICLPVTVENGKPLRYSEWTGQMEKGNQLEVDAADFPTLVETGLLSEIELDQTKTITGRSVVVISEIGRPGRSSGAGFIAHDEDILSVLKGDNRLVRKMRLTHPQTSKVLFHMWNLIFFPYQDIEFILYNGKRIYLEMHGSKGWQDSIFDDEIEGQYTLKIRRELESGEREFLKKKYSCLGQGRLSELIEDLSVIETGEMAFYYIRRYGFYEGHTDFRADPISVAFIFGLRSLEEIEKAFEKNLDEVLNEHFTEEPLSLGVEK
jgi:hypothetical protein